MIPLSALSRPRLTDLDRATLGVTAAGLMAFGSVGTHGDVRWMLAAGAVASAWATRRGDWSLVRTLCALFPSYSMGFYCSIRALSYQPRRIDGILAAWDHGVAYACWHWCAARPWATIPLTVVYYLPGVAIVAATACTRKRGAFLVSLTLAGTLAPFCYWLFPAVGPVALRESSTAFPNAFPSMHMTIALLCWWYTRRWMFTAFAILTACATLGLGEHWSVDLVAAGVFTAGCVWVAEKAVAMIEEQ